MKPRTPTSKLRSHSTAQRLDAYLDENPDEELTVRDVMAKFGVSREAVYSAIETLRERRLVELVHVVRRPAKGRASNGWANGPGVNGGPGGCDVEVTAP